MPLAKGVEQNFQNQAQPPPPAATPAQVIMPPEIEEDFGATKGAMEIFTTFMSSQGQRGGGAPPQAGR